MLPGRISKGVLRFDVNIGQPSHRLKPPVSKLVRKHGGVAPLDRAGKSVRRNIPQHPIVVGAGGTEDSIHPRVLWVRLDGQGASGRVRSPAAKEDPRRFQSPVLRKGVVFVRLTKRAQYVR